MLASRSGRCGLAALALLFVLAPGSARAEDELGRIGAPAKPPPAIPKPDEPDPLIDELFNKPEAPPPAAVPDAPPARPVHPLAEDRAAFRAAVRQVKAQLRQRRTDEATQALAQVEPLAAKLGPAETQGAAQLAYEVALQAKDLATAVKQATAWLLACGPDQVGRCRARALAALDSVARGPLRSASLQEKVKGLREADRCVASLEAGPADVPGCAREAQGRYRRNGDSLMLARVLLARARIEGRRARPEAQIEAYRTAEAACSEPRCLQVRRRALQRLGALFARSGDVEEAARAAILEMDLTIQVTKPADPVHVRPAGVERSCAKLDAVSGAGACRALERRLTGRYTFRDFSYRRAGRGLSPGHVKQVGREYAVLIEDCLKQEAERLKPPDLATYGVRWVVTHQGRVEQVHMERRDQEDGSLASCLREQFAHWRYPRTTGEAQNVEQLFTVRAVQR